MSTDPTNPTPADGVAAGAPPINARARAGGPAPVVVSHDFGASDFKKDVRRLARRRAVPDPRRAVRLTARAGVIRTTRGSGRVRSDAAWFRG